MYVVTKYAHQINHIRRTNLLQFSLKFFKGFLVTQYDELTIEILPSEILK